MLRSKRCLGTLVLSAAMLAPVVINGCAARVGFYDDYGRDYHHWDRREDRSYRIWLRERHYEYRRFNDLDHDKQRDYWQWRHTHHDDH